MAGTTTTTITNRRGPDNKNLKVVSVAFTADSADASVPNTTLAGLFGKLVRTITNPGSTAPTDNYDVKLLSPDDSTADVLAGADADRDTANTETINHSTPIELRGDYTLQVSNNSVNSATGVVILEILED